MKKARGSALFIAILLVTAIGAIAFSFGRVFTMTAISTTIYENGVGAFYAAESGIEEGMLRYRYNNNSEIPSSEWTLAQNDVFRSNLSDKSINIGSGGKGILKTEKITSNDRQFYDLRMGFIGTENKWPFYGHLLEADQNLYDSILKDGYAVGEYSYLKIPKGESYKFDLSNLSFFGNDIDLYAKFASQLTESGKFIVQAKLFVQDAIGVKEYSTMISKDREASCVLLGRTDQSLCVNEMIAASAPVGTTIIKVDGLIEKWRNQAVVSATNFPSLNTATSVILQLRPLFSEISLGMISNSLSPHNKQNTVPGPFTTITSTGYYGGVARTIEARVDRQSGTRYDVFDFVIYNKE